MSISSSEDHGNDFIDALSRVERRWPEGTTSTTIPTSRGLTRVLLRRAGGPPVVLIPGGGATAASWLRVTERLADHDVYAVDILGDAGRSVPSVGRPRSAADVVTWLDETLDGLGLTEVVLVGHSYGGWLALIYALARPDRVISLCLVAPTRCFAPMALGYLLRAIPLLVRPSTRRARRLLAWEIGGIATDEDLRELCVAAMGRRWAGIATPRAPSAADLAGLQMPVDLLLAEHDRSHNNEACADTASRHVAQRKISTVPGASHHTVTDTGASAIAEVIAAAGGQGRTSGR